MSSLFAITTATNTVLLDNNQQGQTSFIVSNTTAQTIHSRVHIVAQPEACISWLTLQGEAERDISASGSQQYTIHIAVPTNSPAGDYTFRLNAADQANPDDNFSEGPTVKFTVTVPDPVKKAFPWWIVAVAVAALVVITGISFSIYKITYKAPTPPPTPVLPTPTSTPTPFVATVGNWQGQFAYSGGGSFRGVLSLNSQPNSAVEGSLTELDYNSVVSVSGSEGPLNHFNIIKQNRLQALINAYGKGSGTFLSFTDPKALQGNQVLLNCTYDAVIFPDGSLHGIWYTRGATQPSGTFLLIKA
ncbi:hypothetical protein [Dictyobacter arantiisoli]|uniref:Uncharacterized protein n=1 Tax=Dictyobacter arantiisoli TaxID=2014874 RepID=A0A5A5TFK7_9CHLR|nr:hypothetical protein [Dictyobacter arantiisoli]GCF09779.1 hypothetical protein KDI_33430 [Dictyobacter arantiisoli]